MPDREEIIKIVETFFNTGKKKNQKSSANARKEAESAVEALKALSELEAKGAISSQKASRLRTAILEDF